MARLTQDRIRRALGQIGEGWALDRQSALIWGELVPMFRIPDEGDSDVYTELELRWDEVYEVKTNEWGQRFHVPTGAYRPMINISHWHRDGEVWASFGLGRNITLTEFEPTNRRMFATLARITRKLTPEACRALAALRTVDVDSLLSEA